MYNANYFIETLTLNYIFKKRITVLVIFLNLKILFVVTYLKQ